MPPKGRAKPKAKAKPKPRAAPLVTRRARPAVTENALPEAAASEAQAALGPGGHLEPAFAELRQEMLGPMGALGGAPILGPVVDVGAGLGPLIGVTPPVQHLTVLSLRLCDMRGCMLIHRVWCQ
eukprot:1141926-Amphidinium_carterae.1